MFGKKSKVSNNGYMAKTHKHNKVYNNSEVDEKENRRSVVAENFFWAVMCALVIYIGWGIWDTGSRWLTGFECELTSQHRTLTDRGYADAYTYVAPVKNDDGTYKAVVEYRVSLTDFKDRERTFEKIEFVQAGDDAIALQLYNIETGEPIDMDNLYPFTSKGFEFLIKGEYDKTFATEQEVYDFSWRLEKVRVYLDEGDVIEFTRLDDQPQRLKESEIDR